MFYTRSVPELLKTVLSNLAALYLKMGSAADALNACEEAFSASKKYSLSSDSSTNCKLLFRRGSAHLLLKDFDLAVIDLEAAVALSPPSPSPSADSALTAKLREAKKSVALLLSLPSLVINYCFGVLLGTLS